MSGSLKLVNYIKLDEKAAHSTRLQMETNHSESELTEPRIHNHGQKFSNNYALLVSLRTRQTQILLDLPNLAPNPNTMLKTTTCSFFWFLTLYWVWRANSSARFKGKQWSFETSVIYWLQNLAKLTWLAYYFANSMVQFLEKAKLINLALYFWAKVIFKTLRTWCQTALWEEMKSIFTNTRLTWP